ncbi:YjcZ family sporulation protein [Brevibacillus thermoruber]
MIIVIIIIEIISNCPAFLNAASVLPSIWPLPPFTARFVFRLRPRFHNVQAKIASWKYSIHSSRKGGKAMGLFRRREEFALVLVLFVLLTIVGCSCD